MNAERVQETSNREPQAEKKLPWWQEFLQRFFLFGFGVCAVNALLELHHAGRPIMGIIIYSAGPAALFAVLTTLVHASERRRK
jgi:hypothetical protein